MRKIVLVAVFAVLTACGSAPKVKKPDESNWEPINKTVPVEIEVMK